MESKSKWMGTMAIMTMATMMMDLGILSFGTDPVGTGVSTSIIKMITTTGAETTATGITMVVAAAVDITAAAAEGIMAEAAEVEVDITVVVVAVVEEDIMVEAAEEADIVRVAVDIAKSLLSLLKYESSFKQEITAIAESC